MRKRPCTDTPTPPPKVMPSISAMCGVRSWEMRWLSLYSERKKLRARGRAGPGRQCVGGQAGRPPPAAAAAPALAAAPSRQGGRLCASRRRHRRRRRRSSSSRRSHRSASSTRPASPICTTPLTSPPAQKALSPMPRSRMQATPGSPSQRQYRSARVSTIPVVSALRARGRLSTATAADSTRSYSTCAQTHVGANRRAAMAAQTGRHVARGVGGAGGRRRSPTPWPPRRPWVPLREPPGALSPPRVAGGVERRVRQRGGV